MPVNVDNRFGGNNPDEIRDHKALEAAGKLEEIFTGDAAVLEKAIRYMGVNTRETLKQALQMAERNK